MAATNAQVQQWANERTRPRAEQLRALLISLQDDNGAIGEVYANLTDSPDWTDQRNDAPPALLTPGDLLAINTLSANLEAILLDDLADDAARAAAVSAVAAQWAIVEKACVRPALDG